MIQAIVLDIEGTTCPIDFVSHTLFPFAQKNLSKALKQRSVDAEIDSLVIESISEWISDPDPTSQIMLEQTTHTPPSTSEVGDYLQHLIQSDKKSPALKELQGIIWKQGYASGELKSSLFEDVHPQLDLWKHNGLILAVYSSGSIQAQKLLYRHTSEGDLTDLFSYWFDTRTGPKLVQQSYETIAEKLGLPVDQVLFVSDHPGECDAARQSGMSTAFCLREGNPHQNAGNHILIQRLSDVDLDSINASENQKS